jgi:hypothetical protein
MVVYLDRLPFDPALVHKIIYIFRRDPRFCDGFGARITCKYGRCSRFPVQSWPCTVPETAAGRGCKGIYDFDYSTLGTFKEAAAFPAFLAHGPLVFFDAFESAIAAA